MKVKCKVCCGTGWVCENHPKKAWGWFVYPYAQTPVKDKRVCFCGAGMACACNDRLTMPSEVPLER